jgi:hypothetical protein
MNSRHRSDLAASLCLALVIMLSTDAHAEVFSDIFVGAAITSDETYTLNGFPVPPTLLCVQQCSSAWSPSGGLRVGYWFDRFSWLGVAGDISGFVPAWGLESPIAVDAFPISLVAIFRLQLVKTEALPDGRLQPYVAIGPTLMTTFATLSTGSNNPIYSPTLGPLMTTTDTSFDVGVDARFGARVLASDFISMFLEYRYTRVSPSWSLGTPTDPANFATTLSTSQITLGMGLHFR